MKKQDFLKIKTERHIVVFGRNLNKLVYVKEPVLTNTPLIPQVLDNTYFADIPNLLKSAEFETPSIFVTNNLVALDSFNENDVYWFDGDDEVLPLVEVSEDILAWLKFMSPCEVALNCEMFQ